MDPRSAKIAGGSLINNVMALLVGRAMMCEYECQKQEIEVFNRENDPTVQT
jgi:hypothetical protein